VEFKVILTYVLEGDDARARAGLDAMKFPGDTAAYYFANAAWEFAHKEPDKGNNWVDRAIAIFGTERCAPFYDSLADFGWVERHAPAGGQ